MQRQRSLSLDFGAWPAADREAWRSAVAPATRLFDLGGAESRLRPATLKLYVDTYGHWLGFLVRTEKEVPAGSAASRVTESRLDAWVGNSASEAIATRPSMAGFAACMVRSAFLSPKHRSASSCVLRAFP